MAEDKKKYKTKRVGARAGKADIAPAYFGPYIILL